MCERAGCPQEAHQRRAGKAEPWPLGTTRIDAGSRFDLETFSPVLLLGSSGFLGLRSGRVGEGLGVLLLRVVRFT